MSTATATTTTTDTRASASYVPSAETLGTVMAPGARPPRPSPLAASLAFGWRAMLTWVLMASAVLAVEFGALTMYRYNRV
jgi:hypothetical protein